MLKCCHFNIYDQDKFHTYGLVEHEKKFITSGPGYLKMWFNKSELGKYGWHTRLISIDSDV